MESVFIDSVSFNFNTDSLLYMYRFTSIVTSRALMNKCTEVTAFSWGFSGVKVYSSPIFMNKVQLVNGHCNRWVSVSAHI